MNRCDPKDIALKTFFLGPRAENSRWVRDTIVEVLEEWFLWRKSKYPDDGDIIIGEDRVNPEFIKRQALLEENLRQLIVMFEKEIPKYSPRYFGHMFSEISLPAIFGHFLTLLHNPNNISQESSTVGVEIENKAIQALARMVGYDVKKSNGHFTSGGTVANYEAFTRARNRFIKNLSLYSSALEKRLVSRPDLFVAGMLDDKNASKLSRLIRQKEISKYSLSESGFFNVKRRIDELYRQEFKAPAVLIPNHKHYSWLKANKLFGFGQESILPVELDQNGRLSISSLKKQIEKCRKESRSIMLTVSVVGSTELGMIDPVYEINETLRFFEKKYGVQFWHHIDAAYGGYFSTMKKISSKNITKTAKKNISAIEGGRSVTIDPHKLGYVPYASGVFLCRNSADYFADDTTAPYVNFEKKLDKGPYTLEGSRPATGAVATWLTSETLGLDEEGYGRILDRTFKVSRKFKKLLKKEFKDKIVFAESETNILCFALKSKSRKISEMNQMNLRLYEKIYKDKDHNYFVSKTKVSDENYGNFLKKIIQDHRLEKNSNTLVLLRITIMNPFLDSKNAKIDHLREFVHNLKNLYSFASKII